MATIGRTGIGTVLAVMLAASGCGNAEATGEVGAPGGGAAGQGSARAEARAPAPARGPVQMQTVDIVDRSGFAQPMLFGRMRVPAGWRTEGGVNWDGSTNCAANQMKVQWRAVAPDGVAAFEFLPGYAWQTPSAYIPMNPCPVERIDSARTFLMMAAQAMRPGARVLGYRQRDDVNGQIQDRPGFQTRLGELTVAYQANGVAVEEILSALVTVGASSGNVGYVVGYRVPAGQLNGDAFEAMRRSFKGEMAYAQAMGQRGMAAVNRFSQAQSQAIASWHARRMSEIDARGAADRAAIRARGNAETNAIYAGTAAGTSATNDGIHAANIRSIREEQTWSDPSTGQTVQGSIHGGQRVLEMPNGSFARTDDPYYNAAGSTEYDPQ